MKKNLIKYFIILLINFIMLTQAGYCDQFKNAITKIDAYQGMQGIVRLNIYTQSPYGDSIIVNKKPENKYVILLPETANSLNTRPSLGAVADLIQDIEIKTQPYSSLPGKGYTKITIAAKKPIDIIPQSYSMTAPKPTVAMAKSTAPRPTSHITTQPRKVVKTTPAPEPEIVPQKVKPVKIAQAASVKPEIKHPQTTIVKKEITKPILTQQPKPTLKTNIQTIPLQQAQTQDNIVVIDDSVLNNKQPEDEQLETERNNAINQSLLNEVISNPPTESVDAPLIKSHKTSIWQPLINFKDGIVKFFKKIFSLKIDFSMGIGVIQLILLIILAKIITDLVKRIQAEKKPDEPESISPFVSYSKINEYNKQKPELLNENNIGFKKQTMNKTTYKVENNYSSAIDKLYKNNSFYKPLEDLSEEEKTEIFTPKNDFEEDIEPIIFKNPLTSISKEEEENLFEDEDEPEKFDEFEIIENEEFPTIPHSKKLSASLAKNSEFFLFENNDYDEINQNNEIEFVEEDEEEDYIEIKEEPDEEVTEKSNLPKAPALNIKSKYMFNQNSGLSLVDFKDKTALIGYINDKIFVLKRFSEKIDSPILARFNERKNETTNVYLVKVADEKMLIQVNPEEIKLLMNL